MTNSAATKHADACETQGAFGRRDVEHCVRCRELAAGATPPRLLPRRELGSHLDLRTRVRCVFSCESAG